MKQLFALILCCQWYVTLSAQHMPPKAEFRAAWVATVLNIDFPNAPTTDLNVLKTEWTELIDQLAAMHFNAVIVQIRPAGDALYPSAYAPWSAYLTGTQGVAPTPNADFLEYMISTAHARSMEFHAWLNPYRVSMNTNVASFAPTHVYHQHPDWLVSYDQRYYLNPGLPAVRSYLRALIMEVVNEYDIDAIHFDDYFYPYKKAGHTFDDDTTYQRFSDASMDKATWRRHNVNLLIDSLSTAIKTAKPYVQFGISPFGVWRNGSQDVRATQTTAGVKSYDDLHADVLEWLKRGWIDYVVPQIYWHIGFEPADYQLLSHWWSQWRYARSMYVGHAVYKVGTDSRPEWNDPAEITRQIALNRQLKGTNGSVFFSTSKLFANKLQVQNSIANNYQSLAKVPALVWLDLPPALPVHNFKVQKTAQGNRLTWQQWDTAPTMPWYYMIYRFEKEQVIDLVSGKHLIAITPFGQTLSSYLDTTANRKKEYTYVITCVNRAHFESSPVFLKE